MAEETFSLRVISPAGTAVEEEVSEVSIPGPQGEIGFLPKHCRYTGALGTGLLSYKNVNSNEHGNVVVSKGFCYFANDTLTVLASTLCDPATADLDEYRQEQQELLEILKEGHFDDPDNQLAREQLACAEAIEKALS
jgi:F-type H+-transporting ATPase subunit epsilon